MDSSLYLTRASKFVEADPVRGIPESGTEYSSYFVVVAPNTDEASKKLRRYLSNHSRSKGWETRETRELTVGAHIPLEDRVAILKEVLSVIE
ncbi:MAG: hypothetical protein AABX26_02200 [Nanoarchaeota archaeon]